MQDREHALFPLPAGRQGSSLGRQGSSLARQGWEVYSWELLPAFLNPTGQQGEGPVLSGQGREEDGSWLVLLLAKGIDLAVASHDGPSHPW